MLIYLLPKINTNIYKHIQIQQTEEPPPPYISQSLSFYLNDTKKQIDSCKSKWDIFKKYTNTFEYIHTIIPNKKTSVSKYKPISRSYFKMIELIDEFHFGLDSLQPIQTFHLAEGPGGFIEAVVNYRKNIKQTRISSLGNKDGGGGGGGGGGRRGEGTGGSDDDDGYLSPSPTGERNELYRNNHDDIYVGMTLLVPIPPPNTEENIHLPTSYLPFYSCSLKKIDKHSGGGNGGGGGVNGGSGGDDYRKLDTTEMPPNWKKIHSFLKDNHNNVIIEKGVDKTGNILSLNNFIKINETYGNTMDFITADGGFDFSVNFSNQELSAIQLIYGQIVFALCMQKQGGSFVLKIYDCFMKSTVELMALLCSVYDSVYITKPNTSRSANSEKYVVCKGFNHSSVELYPYLFFAFKEMLEKKTTPHFIHGFLNKPLPQFFIQKLEKYNGILGQNQLENIEKTLTFINEDENANDWKRKTKTAFDQLKWRNTTVKRYDTVVWNKKKDRYLEGGGGEPSYYKKEQWIQNNKEIDSLVNSNILKCLHWCIKHNFPTSPI